MSDIQQLNRTDALAFRKMYYAPANAVVALVGDLDIDEVKSLADRYFGRLPVRPGPPNIRTAEPAQAGHTNKNKANPMKTNNMLRIPYSLYY